MSMTNCRWFAFVGVAAVGLVPAEGVAADDPARTKDPEGAKKLAMSLPGEWESPKGKASVLFNENNTFVYKSGDVALRGKYRVVDGNTIELTFPLLANQVEQVKP